ncbi:MAG: hypothetical protein DSY77_15585 [Bacteroidetes bacterium]|nr:MAG: hypothetical protein DSY77_15585 [Bacteroidota bacterium]
MKIAVFENQFEDIKGAFEFANLLSFDGNLEIKIFPRSQDCDLETISIFDVIFIDIDLSKKSELDGYGLVKKLQELEGDLLNRIVILTGHSKIKDTMIHRGIDDERIKIVIKPTDFEELTDVINEVITGTTM